MTDAEIRDLFQELIEAEGMTRADALEVTLSEVGDRTREQILAIVGNGSPTRAPAQGSRNAAVGHQEVPRKGPNWGDVAAFARAPYRFASINEIIVPAEETAIGPLNVPIESGLCLDIKVTWRAETSLLIGEIYPGDPTPNDVPTTRPFKVGKDWAIPAASLRGMIRSVLEVAAFGRLSQIDGHLRFPLRDFEHPLYRQSEVDKTPVEGITASPISNSKEVHAGWLVRQGDGYGIEPCLERWGYVPKDHLVKAARTYGPEKALNDKYLSMGGGKWERNVDCERDFGRLPSDHRDGGAFYEPDSKVNVKGRIVFSGKAPSPEKKKYEYVFIGASGPLVPLDTTSWAQFELMSTRQGRSRREPEGSWALLQPIVAEGRRVPVFYVGDLGNQSEGFAFGLTRLFKIPHRFSVADVLNRSGPKAGAELRHGAPSGDAPAKHADFVETLFGYVFEPPKASEVQSRSPSDFARKGKVAFSFARLSGEHFQERAAVSAVMAAPRASFSPFYLTGPIKDYSSEQSRLAGRKRYVVQAGGSSIVQDRISRTYEELRQSRTAGSVPSQQQSALRFLEPKSPDGGQFTSTLRLHNVTPAEAGAILWALDFGGQSECRHLVGRAKGFGAGRLLAEQISLSGEWNKTGAAIDDSAKSELVSAFQKVMTDAVPGWEQSDQIKALRAIASTTESQDLAEPQMGRDAPPVTWLTPLKLTNEPEVNLAGESTGRRTNPFQNLRKVSGLRVKTDRDPGIKASLDAKDRFLTLTPHRRTR